MEGVVLAVVDPLEVAEGAAVVAVAEEAADADRNEQTSCTVTILLLSGQSSL